MFKSLRKNKINSFKKIYIFLVLLCLIFPKNLILAYPQLGVFSPPRTYPVTSSSSLSLSQNSPSEGDLMVAAIMSRSATGPTIASSGWTLLGQYEGTDGLSFAPDTGPVQMTLLYKIADGTEGDTSAVFTRSVTTFSFWTGAIVHFRSSTTTYDLSLGGISFNGDTNNFGGTLDTDIGLTEGDVVFIVSALNTDNVTVSSQDISATGVTAIGDVTERVEFGTTGGFDGRFAISTGQILQGTSTAVPDVTTSISSVGASGSTVVLRVREGSGTQRNDTWIKSVGPAGFGSSFGLTYSEHAPGDLLIALVTNKNLSYTPSISGWTLLDSYTGGLGGNVVDGGSMRLSVFYLPVTSLLSGSLSPYSGSIDIGAAQMFTISRKNVSSWDLDMDGGSDTTANTSWDVTGVDGMELSDVNDGDVLIVSSARNVDQYSYSAQTLTGNNASFLNFREVLFLATNVGTDMSFENFITRVSSALDPITTLNFTATSSGSNSSTNPAGVTAFIRARGSSAVFEQSAFRFFANNNSTDVGTALGLQDSGVTLTSTGDTFRLRMLIHVDDADILASGQSFKLQYAEKSGTCDSSFSGETYEDITTSTPISFYNNVTPDDEDALTVNIGDPTHGADLVVNQSYQEENNFSNSESDILNGQDGKWDFSLYDNGANPETTYCIRAIKGDDSLLDIYTVIPEVTTSVGGGPQTISLSISDNSIGFGTLSASNARFATGDGTGDTNDSSDAHTVSVGTNADGGYILSLNGDTLSCVSCSSTPVIASIGSSPTSSSPGTEQFGIRLSVNSGTGIVSYPYDQSSQFAFDSSVFPDEIASGDGDSVETEYGVRYIANISNTTDAGLYTGILTYTVTASF